MEGTTGSTAKALVCALLDRAGQSRWRTRTTRRLHIHTRRTRTARAFLVPATDTRLRTAVATATTATTATHIAAVEGRTDVVATTRAGAVAVVVSVLKMPGIGACESKVE